MIMEKVKVYVCKEMDGSYFCYIDEKSNLKVVDNSILLTADTPISSFYYELYNAGGQTINKGVSTETVSIGSLPKGIYVLNVTLNGQKKTYKLAL